MSPFQLAIIGFLTIPAALIVYFCFALRGKPEPESNTLDDERISTIRAALEPCYVVQRTLRKVRAGS